MKKIIILLLVFWSSYMNAQTLLSVDHIKLEKASDYKAAEPFVLQTATYLLSSPLKKDDTDRMNLLGFIGKWMHGTPDYSFAFSDIVTKIGKDNNDIIGLYMAAMTKYTLENKAPSRDAKVVKLNALILLLNYCENKDNNIRMTKQLKKLSEAREKGQLEQSLL
ncbi:MAG: hypothetical protein ABIN01_03665 [Ferruginibacter sp.]